MNNYAEINVRVVNLFVNSLCFLVKQRTIASHDKKVRKPLLSPGLLSMIDIDLMDFTIWL